MSIQHHPRSLSLEPPANYRSSNHLHHLKAALKPLFASANELIALDFRPDLFSNLCGDLAPRVHHQEASLDDSRARAGESTPVSGANWLPSSFQSGSASVLVCGLDVDSLEPFDLAKLVASPSVRKRPCFIVLGLGTITTREAELRLGSLHQVLARCGVSASPLQLVDVGDETYYAVIKLEVTEQTERWTLGNLQDTDFEEFHELFVNAFGEDYDQGLWNWKYAEGRGRAVVARRLGRLVAYYGSTERKIRFFGKAGAGLQICDVMVAPKERGIVTKKGAMFLTAAAYIEAYLGVQGKTLGYGFPTKRHMRLGDRLGLYAEVAKMTELRWSGLTIPKDKSRDLILDARSSDDLSWINAAWKKMAQTLADSICTERDLQYLHFRYLEHPTRDYKLYRVSTRLTSRLIGGIVMQKTDEAYELVDVIGPRKNFNRLAAAAKSVAAATQCRALYCWVTDTFVRDFADDTCVVTDLNLSVPTNVWAHGPEPQRLWGKWFLMSGDTEFR